jgi:hypothetical protein
LYRHTSFGTFGGGDVGIFSNSAHMSPTSGGNTTPGGNGGIGIPWGSTVDPGGNTAPAGHCIPGGNTTPGGAPGVCGPGGGGAGTSLAWSTSRTDPDVTVVWQVPGCAAPKSASVAMAAAAPAKITCITRRRFVIPKYFVALLAAG